MNDRSAFTLVELMIVVLIVGVLSAIIFVRLDSVIPGQSLRAASTVIVGAADLARSEARLKQISVNLVYDIDKRTVQVTALPVPPLEEDDETPGGSAIPAVKLPAVAMDKPEVLFSESLPAGVSIKAVYYSESGIAFNGVMSAEFRPSGAVGEHMVVLKEASGGEQSIYVPGLSGSAFSVDKGVSYAQVRASRRLRK